MNFKSLKTLTACILVSVFIFNMISVVNASGENYTGFYTSGEAKAGSWKEEGCHSLSSLSLNNICGGDVGVDFTSPLTGLQNSFARSNNRKVYVYLYEYDGTTSEDDFARSYIGDFMTSVSGVYAPYFFSDWRVSSEGIEGHSEVELYIKFIVQTSPGDTSTTVPRGLLKYRFWIY